ncbi:MAG TPA: extracellular solute-binding protein [Candidatus Limiplasma sp.]|nr:extracellular solute-binding protein [Candidatus Limiplasma sp.]HPR77102.1 extracellular solute-binding protein [Candidatus Limiplasma sp.]
MKKGIISKFLSAALTTSLLVGCGAALTTACAEADQTPVTITYYTWVQSADGAYPQNMIDGFEAKYPWITVDFQMGSNTGGEYSETQSIKLLAGDGIDVTTIKPSDYQQYIDAGYLEDITGSDFLSAYNAAALDAVTSNGKVYGIPFAEDVVGVVYNKTMFDKNGWTVPTNREEYLKLCDTIAATGVTPTVQGIKDTWTTGQEAMIFMQDLYAQHPDLFKNINEGTASYTDADVVAALQEMQDFFSSNAVSKEAAGLTYDQATTYFATEKAAMMTHGEWIMGPINLAEPEFEVGVFPLPTNKAGEAHYGAAEVGQYQAIVASSQHKDAAKLFLSYISSAEGAQYFADTMANMTPVQGVANKALAMWTDLLSEDSLPFYYDQMYSGAQSEFFKQMQLLYSGDTTAADMAAALQAAQDKKE